MLEVPRAPGSEWREGESKRSRSWEWGGARMFQQREKKCDPGLAVSVQRTSEVKGL